MARRMRECDQTSEQAQYDSRGRGVGSRTLTGVVQRRERSPVGAETESRDTSALDGALESSGGAPLPGPLRQQFETSLGTDLSEVRVHTGATSAAAAESVSAVAFAFGQDVHMGAGQYDPSSESGQRLLAHEVAHTVQQRGASGVQTKLEVSTPGDSSEVEADRAADAMLSGAPAQVSLASGIARQIMRQQHPPAQQPAVSPPVPLNVPNQSPWQAPGPHPGPQAIDNGMITQATPVTFTGGHGHETLREGMYVEVLSRTGTNLHIRVPARNNRECDIPAANFRQEPEISVRDRRRETDPLPGQSHPDVRYREQQGQAFVGPPRVEDVHQNGIGDCYLLAAANAVIQSGRGSRLQQIIVPSGDGWQVTLYRQDMTQQNPDRSHPLLSWVRHIDHYFPDNRTWNNSGEAATRNGSQGALWPLILEKAYAQMRGGYQALDNGNHYNPNGPPDETVAMMAITGQQAVHSGPRAGDANSGPIMALPNGQIVPRLQQLLAAHQGVTCATKPSFTGNRPSAHVGHTELHASHVYTLMSVDASGTLTFRNPWGTDHPRGITEAEFRLYFDSVNVG